MAPTAQKVPSIIEETSLARGLYPLVKGPCPHSKKQLWGVDMSAQCLNLVQDGEGNLLRICSQSKAHRSKYLTQSGNNHTPCLGLSNCQEHQNLKARSLRRECLIRSTHLFSLMNALVFLSSCWLLGSEELGVWHSSQGNRFAHNFGMFVSVHKRKLNSTLVPSSNLA